MTKDELRSKYGHFRTAINQNELEQASIDTADRFAMFLATHPSVTNVACYLSYRRELPTRPLIDLCIDAGVKLAVPAWNGETYNFVWFDKDAELEDGPKGIKQPRFLNYAKVTDIDLFVVPGLVFSTDGGRIGYGGGWYDRLLLNRRDDSICAGYCFDVQVSLESLPLELHDLRMDMIMTPTRLFRVSKR